jgi:large subunit ribosomal protein L21e
MKGSQGMRRDTRGFKVKVREKGKVHIRKYMKDFSESDRVSIKIDPSFQNIPHPRYQGRAGQITGKQGRAYLVKITDGGKNKTLIVNPEHLISLK